MKKYRKYFILSPLLITFISMLFFNYAFQQLIKNERNIKTNATFSVADNLSELVKKDSSLTTQQIKDITIMVIEFVDTAYYMTFAAVYDDSLNLLTSRHIEVEARGALDPREYKDFLKAISLSKNGIVELDFNGIHYYMKYT